MKKLVLALAVCAAVPAAFAESNVTLYGGADAGLTVQKFKGQDTMVSLSNGNWITNMFGFAGTEDLGNGNSVFFRLEQGYDLTTGEGEGAFNRQAFLGVEGSLGQLAFGRIGALGSDNVEYSIHGSSAYTTSFSPLF